MEVLYLIIPISLVLLCLILAALLWAVSTEQFEDLDRAAMEPLLDEEPQDACPPANSHNSPDKV